MDIDKILAEAPVNAVYWSPQVEQYFSQGFISLAPAFVGRFIVVEETERKELVRLDTIKG